jgi:hypothetical protein
MQIYELFSSFSLVKDHNNNQLHTKDQNSCFLFFLKKIYLFYYFKYKITNRPNCLMDGFQSISVIVFRPNCLVDGFQSINSFRI